MSKNYYWTGLSSATKPTGAAIPPGALALETDTGNIYEYNGAGGWRQTGAGGSILTHIKSTDLITSAENVQAFSGTINGKTLNDSYKMPDFQDFSSVTILLTVTQTAAVGDGRIAIRGYMDVAQTVTTPDLAVINLNSTTPATRLAVMPITAGATTASFILQLTDIEYTALGVYTKVADTGTAVSVAITVLAKGAH